MSPSPNTPIWPPIRAKKRRVNNENEAPTTPSTPTPAARSPLSSDLETLRLTFKTPLQQNRRFQNGYETPAPKQPTHKPYTLASSGKTRQKPIEFPAADFLRPLAPISEERLNILAKQHGILKAGQKLKDYQVSGTNKIIGREMDICIVAPTGAGKSSLWTLPLLVQGKGISLVIVPFTSLGVQGENRHRDTSVASTFLTSGSAGLQVLERIARGGEMHVVYACPEMLETPSLARVIHSTSFQRQLSGVYIDEAHVVYESITWRPSYTRLHILRQILGTDTPLVAMSATLPLRYRQALPIYTGLREDYHLINEGNFRPELSTIVKHMQHSARSFLDLEFIVKLAQHGEFIIVYCDDLETLTAMFWWTYTKLASSNLPVSWLNIMHAGLSDEHQRRCVEAACNGRVRILLGSDKIGAGMDFPSVTVVVQYQCRGLTLVRWEQRKGRGARRVGMTAVGIILVEKSMAGEEKGSPTVTAPKSEDPGLLELIQTDNCLQQCIDRMLENPARGILALCPGCSNCDPSLANITLSYVFMLENPHKPTGRISLSDSEMDKIYQDLIRWRQEQWTSSWEGEWPCYSVECLVDDADLRELARRAPNLSNIDDIDAVAAIPHLHILGESLLKAVQIACTSHIPSTTNNDSDGATTQSPQVGAAAASGVQAPDGPVELRWQEPETVVSFEAAEAVRDWENRVGTLSYGEMVFAL